MDETALISSNHHLWYPFHKSGIRNAAKFHCHILYILTRRSVPTHQEWMKSEWSLQRIQSSVTWRIMLIQKLTTRRKAWFSSNVTFFVVGNGMRLAVAWVSVVAVLPALNSKGLNTVIQFGNVNVNSRSTWTSSRPEMISIRYRGQNRSIVGQSVSQDILPIRCYCESDIHMRSSIPSRGSYSTWAMWTNIEFYRL